MIRNIPSEALCFHLWPMIESFIISGFAVEPSFPFPIRDFLTLKLPQECGWFLKSCQAWRNLELGRVFVALWSFPRSLCFFFFCLKLSQKKKPWYTPQHHTKHKQPLKSCLCTNLSLTLAWNWQAKLLNLIVWKNKEKAVLSFIIIIIPHYHTELLRACRRRLHWASSTLQVLSDPGNGEIHLCWRWHVPSWSRHDRFIACFAIYRHSRRWSGHDIPLQGSAAHW